jgi:hypothetical protein
MRYVVTFRGLPCFDSMKNLRWFVCGLCFLIGSLARALPAQLTDDSISALILEKDALFWKGYNSCDIESCRNFFTDDVEFYHDKGGVTLGIEALTESLKSSLCGNSRWRLRREAVAGTVQVFPMRKGTDTYGAVISGEHVFYVTEEGKPEYLDGRARFMQLWLLKNGDWKMARILSFNHHQAPYENKRVEITLSQERLDRFIGLYNGPHTGKVTISREKNALVMQTDKDRLVLYAESYDTFFVKERPLTFQFETKDGVASKMVVRENGAVAEELAR